MNTLSDSSAASAPAKEASPYQYTVVDGYDQTAGSIENELTAQDKNRRQQADVFEQGRQQGQREMRAELDAALNAERQRVSDALEAFSMERRTYYLRVEAEIVELAVNIARRILHREAQIDPNVLIGIVRITLEKLDAGTKVNLRVAPGDAADWRHYFACQTEGGPIPEVLEETSLPAGQCRIETSVGTTTVGFEPQLQEIEAGLLDILSERPKGSAAQPGPQNQ